MQIYPFHLCQPDESKSCGACCGLYNWQDYSRSTLKFSLRRRTKLFQQAKAKEDLAGYRQKIKALENIPPLSGDIYNCEFLGFIDQAEKKVGCLLHPALNEGLDLREFSFYGGALCAHHFCLSYSYLHYMEQLSVIKTIDDWYLYGLVITDIDLVKEFFKEIQARLGDSIRPEKLGDRKVHQALQDFFKLKESWKFAAPKNRLGKYYFSQAEWQIARIEYAKRWQIKPSRFDKILVSLSSEFKNLGEVHEAENIVEEKIKNFLTAYLG